MDSLYQMLIMYMYLMQKGSIFVFYFMQFGGHWKEALALRKQKADPLAFTQPVRRKYMFDVTLNLAGPYAVVMVIYRRVFCIITPAV